MTTAAHELRCDFKIAYGGFSFSHAMIALKTPDLMILSRIRSV